MTNEEILAQDNMLWTNEGRKRILELMAKAVQVERDRCIEIIEAARSGELDRDWRSLKHVIEMGMTAEQAKG